jgi:hypothetical protein
MNNKYTLYVDESGDFESPRGHWVIAGFLIDEGYEDSERLLNAKFAKLPGLLGERSIKDFHLTEFRSKYGHEEALTKAGLTLRTLDKIDVDYNFVSVINFTKTKAQVRERTYRLMLADLLAMLETALSSESVINHLDVVVATRTIRGVRQTSVSDIDHDIIESLPFAMEIDLATRGLVDLLGKHLKVRMEYATDSWGLICADFAANISYHRDKAREREFLSNLEANGKYCYFESFGGFEARRARVAERNGDFSAAMYHWIAIKHSGDGMGEADEAIQRIFRKVFNRSGSSGANVVFEALIERIWRQRGASQDFSQILAELQNLDRQLGSFLSVDSRNNFDHLQFRLRNLMLIACNHLGETDHASEIVTLQSQSATRLATNPEYFNRVLDYRITATENLVNRLEIEEALLQALDHSKVVENYYEVWRLLVEEDDQYDFHSSRFYIKSEMSLLRLCVIAYGQSYVFSDSEIEKKFDKLEALLQDPRDRSRLFNYRAMFLLKQRSWHEAIELQLQRAENFIDHKYDEFDVFWLLRAVNDGLLNCVKAIGENASHTVDMIIGDICWENRGHPYDLIAREVGLYYFLNGKPSQAKKMIRKSKSFALGTNASISKFLQCVLEVHEDFIFDRASNAQDILQKIESISWVNGILREESEMTLLKKLRYYSPY